MYKKRENIYDIWHAMIDRCYNEKNYRFKWYGGIGVTVCEEWHMFENFKIWYDKNYIKDYQVDKDILCEKLNIVPAIYSPETCMFISKKENIGIRNKKHKKFGEDNHFYGKKHTPESRKKMSDSQKGKIQSEEQKKEKSFKSD